MGKVGPISDDMICYQVGTRLYAADPLTGETLWERGNMSRGSDLFGDDRHVLVVAPGARQATVLRAGDGELVGVRPMPGGNGLDIQKCSTDTASSGLGHFLADR